MNRRVVGKLTRAAALSLLVLTTTSGVAGLQLLAASPAIADPGDQAAGDQVAEEAPAPAPAKPEKGPLDDVLGILGV